MDTRTSPGATHEGGTEGVTIASWYRFVALDNCEALKRELSTYCNAARLRGTILLSTEGINGTVAGDRERIQRFFRWLMEMREFKGLAYKEFQSARMPFHRMKVRIKKEIISVGVQLHASRARGISVEPCEWNTLVDDPAVLVLDARNHYETAIGTFRRALSPDLESFREFPDFVREKLDPARHRRVAMFCTGGIRCEKASALLLEQGFRQVFQLKGGILEYLRVVPESESRWLGECFVFDERVAVGHGCSAGSHEQCFACRHPVSADDKAAPEYEKGVSCPQCFGKRNDADRKRYRERQRQVELAAGRGTGHIGTKVVDS